MSHYTSITIIYNPNSTGGSEALAKEVLEKLQHALPHTSISTVATEHAGHAEELAYALSKASSKPLLISASGDGGYNEVINGAMQAKQEGATPTTGLLPTGNANDHFNALHEVDFIQSVVTGNERTIDVLKMTVSLPEKPLVRYAHSYIGLGLTPEVGHELNKTQLNKIKEAWITVKSFMAFKRIKIKVAGKVRAYHSLVFSNINRMAKILSLTKESKVDDGIFEVSALRHTNKFAFALSLLKASTQGTYSTTEASRYTFRTVDRTLVQLDGEIIQVAPGSEVTITISHKALACIV